MEKKKKYTRGCQQFSWKRELAMLVFLGIMIFLFWNAQQANYVLNLDKYSPFARPAFWPQLSIVGLTLAVFWLIYFSARTEVLSMEEQMALQSEAYAGASFEKARPESFRELFPRRFIIGIIVVYGYIFSTYYIGFPLATLAFIFLYMYIIGKERKVKRLVLTPLLSTVAVMIIFNRFFYIAYPTGKWLFYDISRALLSLCRIGM